MIQLHEEVDEVEVRVPVDEVVNARLLCCRIGLAPTMFAATIRRLMIVEENILKVIRENKSLPQSVVTSNGTGIGKQ